VPESIMPKELNITGIDVFKCNLNQKILT